MPTQPTPQPNPASPLLGVRLASPWLRVSDIPAPHRYYLVAALSNARPDALCRSADGEPCLRSRDFVSWVALQQRRGETIPDPGLTDADLAALAERLPHMPHEREPQVRLEEAWLVEVEDGAPEAQWLAGGIIGVSETAPPDAPEPGTRIVTDQILGFWLEDDQSVIAYDRLGRVYRLAPTVFLAWLDQRLVPRLIAGEHPSAIMMAEMRQRFSGTLGQSERLRHQPVKETFSWGQLADLYDAEGKSMFVCLWGAVAGGQGRWIRTSDVQRISDELPVRLMTLNSVYRVNAPLTAYRLPYDPAWGLLNVGFSPAEIAWRLMFQAPDAAGHAKDAAPDAGEPGEADDKDP